MRNILDRKGTTALIVAASGLCWVVFSTAGEVAATPIDDAGTAGVGSSPLGGAEPPETEEEFYRLCPKCGAPNFPAAKYCKQCDAALIPATKRLAGLRKYAAAVVAVGAPYRAGGGVFARFDWDRLSWGGEYALAGAYVDEKSDRRATPHYLENSLRMFFGRRPFRPFFALELRLRYEYVSGEYYSYGSDGSDRYVVVPTLGGGLNLNYGVHPSYAEIAATAGWAGDTAGRYRNVLVSSFALNLTCENVTYFWPRFGLLARGSITSPAVHDTRYFLLVSIGPVFSW